MREINVIEWLLSADSVEKTKKCQVRSLTGRNFCLGAGGKSDVLEIHTKEMQVGM